MISPGPGRPRLQQPLRPGASTREEILDAAAESFTSKGFTNTSTRSIAQAVGIRQSSLYHHFGTKDEILEELLAGTVSSSLSFARYVAAVPVDVNLAGSRLHALTLYDGTQLCSSPWNLGVLYHLPEVRHLRFKAFLSDRQELRNLYRELGLDLLSSEWSASVGINIGEFAFRLTEALISLRADGMTTPDSAIQMADSVLAASGYAASLPSVHLRSQELIENWAAATSKNPDSAKL